MIQKFLTSVFELIDKVNKSKYTSSIKVFRTPKNAFSSREMLFERKGNPDFCMTSKMTII